MTAAGVSFLRRISTFRPLFDSLREPLAHSPPRDPNHVLKSEMWKKIFYFACCPALVLSAINVLLSEEKERPEFKPYEHLRIRRKKFPWGDGNHTLFHNPHMNALPEGYET